MKKILFTLSVVIFSFIFIGVVNLSAENTSNWPSNVSYHESDRPLSYNYISYLINIINEIKERSLYFYSDLSNASIGIGINPSVGSKLEVNGKLKAISFEGDGALITGISDLWQGAKDVNLNYNSGNVVIGDTSTTAKLGVNGGVGIGSTYSENSLASPNDLIIEGDVGIGLSVVNSTLSLSGAMKLSNSNIACDLNNIGSMQFDSVNSELQYCTANGWNSLYRDSPKGILEINPALSCKDIKDYNPEVKNGIYWIDPDGVGANAAYQVECDMEYDGGGWTIVALHSSITQWSGGTS